MKLTRGQKIAIGKRGGRTFEENFWTFVEKKDNGCWEWKGATVVGGYGTLTFNNKNYRAHRISFDMVNGEIARGLLVLHKCDNPPCVNPSHLSIGTNDDNMKDAAIKNRMSFGEHRWNSKLKASDIPKIKKLKGSGMSQSRIAKLFNIDQAVISRIMNGKVWRHQ